MPAPPLPATRGEYALFLDFDGTLVELAPTPDAVAPDPRLVQLLSALATGLDGALAIVSGRGITTLDRLLAPLRLAAAGLHGIERRRADGSRRVAAAIPPWLEALRGPLRAHVERHPGLLLEDKYGALAVHYRAAPHHEPATRAWLRTQVAMTAGDAEILEGAACSRSAPRVVDKGTAVEEFLSEPPFAGRRPVFVGDDLSDAAGLRAVQRRGGIAVAVGGRVSADWRLAGPREVRSWLAALLDTVGAR